MLCKYSAHFIFTGEWMMSVNRPESQKPVAEATEELDKDKDTSEDDKTSNSEPKGDPEMAPVYLKRLLPVFAQVYQRTMMTSIRLILKYKYILICLVKLSN